MKTINANLRNLGSLSLLGLLTLVSAILGCNDLESSTALYSSRLYKVERVIDGDTLVVKGMNNPIRLACINAPEIAKIGHPLNTAEEGAYEAKQALENMLATSANQIYIKSLGYLSYNRLVAHVYHKDDPKANIGVELVKRNYAEIQPWHKGCNNVTTF